MNKIYHFIGIGGIGMSGLARILLQRGMQVQGSDKVLSAITQNLTELGALIFQGHEASQIPENGVVVYSSDIAKNNPEYREAMRRGLLLMHRSHLLSVLMQDRRSLLVTGTHGKTTTSSLLSHVLISAGIDPSYCIGGVIQGLQSQSGHGGGDWFVAEADESDGSFLVYNPMGAILTNIDSDHLNHWKTEEKLVQGFLAFYDKIENKNFCLWCADDLGLLGLSLQGVGYGFSSHAALRIVKGETYGWKSHFSLLWEGEEYTDITVSLIGQHNILNATAVFGLCMQIGIEKNVICQGLASFQGVGRRAEKKGSKKEIDVYDDYAHHPTEILATLRAMKQAIGKRRLVVLFQPHRYTRTRDCFSLFAPALREADFLVLTDIYAAGESLIETVTTENLYKEISSQREHDCLYIPREQLVEKTLRLLAPGDVLVSIGAGDVTLVGPEILMRL